jgi:hypothetical protein
LITLHHQQQEVAGIESNHRFMHLKKKLKIGCPEPGVPPAQNTLNWKIVALQKWRTILLLL